MAKSKKTEKTVKTRRGIIQFLKREGPTDANALRQHLYDMEDEKLVTYEEEHRSFGRPAKMWRLTDEADTYFPNSHAELTIDLIDVIKRSLGQDGLDKVIKERGKSQLKRYKDELKSKDGLAKRLKGLAKIRTVEGYMAEVEKNKDGSFTFIENHCPICAAATHCSGLCQSELDVFRSVLGRDVHVIREDHIIQSARRCSYRITSA
jgi:predicted ArsR family transcriptional regulator